MSSASNSLFNHVLSDCYTYLILLFFALPFNSDAVLCRGPVQRNERRQTKAGSHHSFVCDHGAGHCVEVLSVDLLSQAECVHQE